MAQKPMMRADVYARAWGSALTTKAAKNLERIHIQMAQKPKMRADVYARALRTSQNVIRAEVWAAKLRGGVEELVLNPFVVVFGPFLPARVVREVSRTEELAERRRAHSVDHAGLEVEEHCAWCVHVA
jgi:hypothetical protein